MDNSSVVIDNGSGFCKGGLSGQDAPRTKFRSIIGKPKMPSIMVGMDQKQAYVGDDAQDKKGVLFIKNPISHGVITNWEDMTKIWHYTYYNELRVTPEQHPCLLTQTPLNPKINRQTMTQVMFETFNVPSLYLAIQAVLSLYSSGRTTGLVLDSGSGVTNTVPIYEGYALPHAIERNNFAGNQLTQTLHKLLEQAGMKFSLSSEFNIIEDIKDQHCYIAKDFNQEIKKYQQTNKNDTFYQLPDKQKITLGNQRFRTSQVMFNPSRFNKEMTGFHEMVYQSIMKCDLDVRKDLFSNIILSGGSTMLSGMTQRVSKEITSLIPPSTKVHVIGLPQRQFLAWVGGSILSSLATFQAMWISKSQYVQSGRNTVHRKCF